MRSRSARPAPGPARRVAPGPARRGASDPLRRPTGGPLRRTALGLALAGGALGVLAPAPASAAGPSAPSRCGALHGKDLVPANPRIRLVGVRYTQRSEDGPFRRRRYFACSGTRGRVHRVADVGASLGYGDSVGIGPSAGTFVLLKQGGGNVLGDYFEADWRVLDATTGRAYRFWRFRAGDEKNALPTPASVVVDAGGRAAGVFAPGGVSDGYGEDPYTALPAGATTAVASFSATGRRTIRDSGGDEIAPSSLALAGTVASWTHGGAARTADLGPLPASVLVACSSAGLRAQRTTGGTTFSVAVDDVTVAGATCGTARTLAAATARRELAGTLRPSVRGFAVSVTRPCPGCSPVLPVVATRGPVEVRFELHGGA
ncbi:hypothetical protein [Patulibacter minatonensis]|uniref:hypothetical protein n=1 Tax=Patulibacter minatonensis TaxID=298163 RepID=UPI0012FB05DA|nr:hypothetical protein [Patulibacter minatonensis]